MKTSNGLQELCAVRDPRMRVDFNAVYVASSVSREEHPG